MQEYVTSCIWEKNMQKDIIFQKGGESFSTIIERNACYVDKTSYLKTLFFGTSDDLILSLSVFAALVRLLIWI